MGYHCIVCGFGATQQFTNDSDWPVRWYCALHGFMDEDDVERDGYVDPVAAEILGDT